MRVSLKWLDKYIDTSKLDVEKLADELTFKAVEVEGIHQLGENMQNVVVGQVKEVKDHPTTDNLKVAQLNIGDEELQIVTAANNLAKDLLVPVAKIGAQLVNSPVIKKAKLKGVESEGMLCRKQELGLGTADNELNALILPKSTKIGQPIAEALGLNDTVMELDVLANRTDLMGHEGVAREIAVVADLEMKKKPANKLPKEEKNLDIKITNSAPEMCQRFSALVISGIKVAESPDWLKSQLMAIGVRPINNIVDLTNYMMFDKSHVYHAFDYDKIVGQTMNVREAKPGEKIKVLDGSEHKLEKGMLVIEDGKNLIDLPGIMGGFDSGINDQTKNIVLISAGDDSFTIRKTSRRLGLRSDAVSVIEKGMDVESVFQALTDAFALLQQLLPEVKLEKSFDDYPKPIKKEAVILNLEKMTVLLGKEIPKDEIIKTFEKLGIEIDKDKKDHLELVAPSWRLDLNLEEDFIEEAARIHGLNNLLDTPNHADLVPVNFDKRVKYLIETRKMLASLGFDEVYNFSFIGEELIKKVAGSTEGHLTINNPLSEEHKYMRQELISSVLNSVNVNVKNLDEFSIFEMAKVYFAGQGDDMVEGYKIVGADFNKNKKENFYKVKADVEFLLNKFGISDFEYKSLAKDDVSCQKIYDCEKAANIFVGEIPIGTIGSVNKDIKNNFDIEGNLAIFDISYEQLIKLLNQEKYYSEISKFPAVEKDIALVVDKSVTWQEIEIIVLEAGKSLVSSVEMFDVYTGKQIANNKKSIAFNIVYLDSQKTLKTTEVEKVQDKIINELENKLGGKIRK